MKIARIAIYGAGMVATSVYSAIKLLYESCRVLCFIVSDKEGNPDHIDHLPVMTLEEYTDYLSGTEADWEDVKILIAAPENHHQAIAEELKKRKLDRYAAIDSGAEAKLMERYCSRINRFPSLRAFSLTEAGRSGEQERDVSIRVYMARCHRDSPLRNAYDPPKWVHPIQAGAALAEHYIADIRDNEGDNISEKNGNYSELTALYWIWKNAGEKSKREKDGSKAGERGKEGSRYLGLFHYRRILDVTEEDIRRLREHDIDVVLPYPAIQYPSIEEHHKRYVKDSDWKAMELALEQSAPEYAKGLEKIMSQPYFYNYNMLIAKDNVFRDFCGWLFPVLKRTEELSSPKGWERSDRYIGYLGENLTTVYFMHHEGELKTAHAGRRMLL